MKHVISRMLAGLGAITVLTMLAGAPPAAALEREPCDPGGTTQQDVTIGQQLNTQLTKAMRNGMGAYQTSCARVIVDTVRTRGLPVRAAVIAVTTVIVETRLQNLDGGNRDSVGLYQQRAGWGSFEQRMNPVWSTNRFLTAMLELPDDWRTGDIGDICQDVQRSAFPDRYGEEVSDARLIVDALWDDETPTLPGLSVISRGVGGLDVFAVTTDHRLKHRSSSNGVWSCWVTLNSNARIKGDPAAIAGTNRIDVFAQGIDNRLKKITFTAAGGWGAWSDLGEYTITSSPAVTSRSATGIDVFARNANNKIVYRHYNTATSTWTNQWSTIGDNAATTNVSSAPAAVANPDGTRMTILARDTDGSLLSLMWTRDSGWFNWADRGGAFTGRPAASTRAANSVDVFLRDTDNSLVHRFTSDGANWSTHSPTDLGGYITTSPTAVSWNNQRIDVFTRNNQADLIQKTWTPATAWTPWSGHGDIGAPAC